ncbi:MAG: SPOR domain-containing protein [Alphaproteobacteria bacterium]|nr:SPOR domain-containing protein [Alphaproteobacteria bacterium]
MAGQSDSSDDLINELSRLMAQDASGNRAEPAAPAAQSFSVRIPGEPKPPQADDVAQSPVPNGAPMDFLRSIPSLAPEGRAPAVSAPPVAAQPSPRAEPRVDTPAAPQAPEHETFNFDFDFDIGSGRTDTAEQQFPSSRMSAAPARTPAVSAAEPVAAPSVSPSHDEHDSIADLIAADLSSDFAQASAPASAPPRIEPTPQPVAPPTASSPQGPAPRTLPRLDNDRFKVPPVFGLGSSASPQAPVVASQTPPRLPPRTVMPHVETPPPAAQQAPLERQPAPVQHPAPVDSSGLDPIDEIESLIGRAMRVDFTPTVDEPVIAEPVATKPVPAPALRSLATPTQSTQPQRAPLSAADEVIFAAAEATGAQIGWVNEPEIARDDIAEEDRAPRQRRGRAFHMTRAVAGPLVAIGLLLVAGLGLYWVLGLGGSETGPAPLLAADPAPIKQVAPAETTAPQQSVVFNEIDGVAAGADEQLVSRDQTTTDETVQTAAAIPAVSEEGLANRKVRTVTVRPDGTIVTSDGGVAGSSILPVDRPNVPAVPGATDTATELLAAAQTPATTPPAEPVAAVTATPAVAGSTVPAVDLTGNAIAGKTAVIPFTRPSGLTLPAQSLPTAAATEVPAQQPVAETVATPAAAPTSTAPAYVQLSSQRTEADARASAQAMVTRYGPLFGGANLEVQRVDLGAKGIYYRVRVPAASAEQAGMICTNVKAAGGDCFIM